MHVSYEGDTLYPGTQDSYKREAQFRIQLPNSFPATSWNPANDWSYQTVGASGQTAVKAINMPIYDGGLQIWGAEPGEPPVRTVDRTHPVAKPADLIRISGIDGRYLLVGLTCKEKAVISLLTPAGRCVLRSSIKGATYIPLADVPCGVYLCVVSGRDNGQLAARTIVVQR